jgi:DNA (cytosine-5)-methyltransferase 1
MGVRNQRRTSARGKAPARAAAISQDAGSPRLKLTVASLFSGIGGFDLGFQRAGFRIAYQCEIDPFCRSILKKHWPEVPKEDDIRNVASESALPVCDVWVGGFPCQDVSLARMGPRAGLRGQQSGLFHEFSRLLEQSHPAVCVIENVPGLLSSHRGRDFEIVIRTLAQLGYAVGWRVLNSKNFGVPQSRQRVFIVGCYRERGGPPEILFEPECGAGNAKAGRPHGEKPVSPFKESVGDFSKGPIVKKLAHCLYACSARHTGTDWSRNYVCYPDGRVRRLTPVECERIQGFPDGWSIPDEDNRDPDELDSLRYHALGNAVTVPVAEWLASRIRMWLEGRLRDGACVC